MPEPRLTVVMAVRDGEDFVEAAVASVLAQTYRGLRALVVDDGSTDRTPAILARLAQADDRLDLMANPGVPGLAGALAAGFDVATTEYIARLDADDLAAPTRLAQQVAFLDRHPTIGLVGSACVVFDQNGDRDVWSLPAAPLAVRWRSLLANPFLHPTVAIRRAVLVDAGLNYDPRLAAAQDYDLWTRALEHTDGANLAAPLVRYRLHDGQVTAQRRDAQLTLHDEIAIRTIRVEVPELTLDESDVRDLRALFHGGAESSRDPVETATVYLDLLDAFLQRYDHDSRARTALKRAEALRVLGVLARAGAVTRGRTLATRLLQLDPALPLRASAAAMRAQVRRVQR